MLDQLENVTKPVSIAEYWYRSSSSNNTTDMSKKSLNEILGEIRKIDPSVQKFSDIGRFVIARPEYDDLVVKLIKRSGYTDIWRFDYEGDFAWLKDIELMRAFPDKAAVRFQCESAMKAEPRDDNRFTKTLAGISLDDHRYPRNTFKILIKLYAKLSMLHKMRYDTAAQWLSENPTR